MKGMTKKDKELLADFPKPRNRKNIKFSTRDIFGVGECEGGIRCPYHRPSQQG